MKPTSFPEYLLPDVPIVYPLTVYPFPLKVPVKGVELLPRGIQL